MKSLEEVKMNVHEIVIVEIYAPKDDCNIKMKKE